MTFRLKNAPATFQRMVQGIFDEYLTTFMQVFLYDFSVFEHKSMHLEYLHKFLLKCWSLQLILNLEKCAFATQSEVLLGHVILEEGIVDDEKKMEIIRKM